MRLERKWILILLIVGASASQPGEAQAQATVLDTREMSWEPTNTPGFPIGATRKLLHIEQETGAGAALRRHPAGYVEPRHYHTTDAHAIYVLEGRLDVGGVEAGPGTFFYFPANTAHGPMVSLEDSVFLIWAAGPLDIKLGDPPQESAPPDPQTDLERN